MKKTNIFEELTLRDVNRLWYVTSALKVFTGNITRHHKLNSFFIELLKIQITEIMIGIWQVLNICPPYSVYKKIYFKYWV